MWNATSCRCALVASAYLMMGAIVAPAMAQTDQPVAAGAPRFSVTPFVAMGDDLALGGGAAVTLPVASWASLEAEASLGTDAARTGLSILAKVAQFGRVTTYLAGGAGVQRDEVDEPFRGGAWPGTRKKTEFAVGIGGGATVPVGPRWQYRVDFRWYNPKAEWPESWRVYNGLSLRLPNGR